jgi:hypothetical protein
MKIFLKENGFMIGIIMFTLSLVIINIIQGNPLILPGYWWRLTP